MVGLLVGEDGAAVPALPIGSSLDDSIYKFLMIQLQISFNQNDGAA